MMNHRHSLRKLTQDGVTFVELLIVMGLLAAFLVVIATIFTATVDIQGQSNAYSSTVGDGRFIMARLNYDIMRASAVTTPNALSGSGASLVMTVGGSTYTYSVVGGNLQLNDSTTTANLNSDGTTISGLTFQRLGNAGGKDTIRYSFTITSVTKHEGTQDTQTFTSTAERR